MGSPAEPVITVKGVGKRYGGVVALESVTLDLRAGEVLALVGDNGAGKSTLVKIVAGADHPSMGHVLLHGEKIELHSTRDARAHGIEAVYQTLALADDLPVWANMFLGREIKVRGLLGSLGWLNQRAMRSQSRDELDKLRVSVPDVGAQVRNLSGGQRQAIAIGRAVTWARKVVIMDEPTAALGPEQQEKVLSLIRRVRDQGLSVLLVSHSLQHVLSVADRVAVLRHGRLVALVRASETHVDEIVGYITGTREGYVPTEGVPWS